MEGFLANTQIFEYTIKFLIVLFKNELNLSSTLKTKIMQKLFITLAFFFSTHFAMAQDDFKADVLKVIQQSGAAAPMRSAKEQIMQNIPLTKRADFGKEFDATLPALYEKMTKVYMEVYTHEDVKQMLKFYDSPVGKKMAGSLDELTTKSMAAGEEWASELQGIMMKYMQ
jgi:hypothetical protein